MTLNGPAPKISLTVTALVSFVCGATGAILMWAILGQLSFRTVGQKLLQSGTVALTIVNGLFLLREYLRSRPRLGVSPIHPDVYQWWFKLPDGVNDGQVARRVGFLTYVGISNLGYRAVTFTQWRLTVKSASGHPIELRSMNLPSVQLDLKSVIKVFRILGQATDQHQPSQRLESGDSTSGMSFFVYEVHGDLSWDPRIVDGQIVGRFVLLDVFKSQATCDVVFRERSYEHMKKMIPGLDDFVLQLDAERASGMHAPPVS